MTKPKETKDQMLERLARGNPVDLDLLKRTRAELKKLAEIGMHRPGRYSLTPQLGRVANSRVRIKGE